MSHWDTYPSTYRNGEIEALLAALRTGECAALLGLSGAGKSNLLGFLAMRVAGSPWAEGIDVVLVDCNRLQSMRSPALHALIAQSLGAPLEEDISLAALENQIGSRLAGGAGLCLAFDRFDLIQGGAIPGVEGSLRALRDTFKYRLTYLTAARRPVDRQSELAELFFAHTFWLGPLADQDARWSIEAFATRAGATWGDNEVKILAEVSGGYPSFLRAVCEAYAAGAALTLDSLASHPAVQRRLAEFWDDGPSPEMVKASGIERIPLLAASAAELPESGKLTAKEQLLYKYLKSRPNQVCTKDELIRAVWPEDQIYEEGIRDDSLAQIIRRLRVKIEPNPSKPRFIHTVPGRGYLYRGR